MGNTSHFSPLYIHKHNNDGNLGGNPMEVNVIFKVNLEENDPELPAEI